MTEEAIEIENKEIAKQYKKLLNISYRTLTKEDKKLIRSAGRRHRLYIGRYRTDVW